GQCWATRVTGRALAFLKQVRRDEPFVLVVSYDEPHPPMMCPSPFMERFVGVEVPIPQTIAEDLSAKPELQRRNARWHSERWNLGPETLAEGIRHWYAGTAYVDAEVGRLLDALDAGLAEETTIIYTCDHGDLLGAHGMCGKGAMMYEETNRV
ncbi:MAG: sulfatase-like hydrolase/transferase, partial [Planctomycetes bacterium]|nr:sulfatase-like hydrolase/transferase [Planctomycetota bacterium]